MTYSINIEVYIYIYIYIYTCIYIYLYSFVVRTKAHPFMSRYERNCNYFSLLVIAFRKQGIRCDWTLDFSMQAHVQYYVEFRHNQFCCCDTQICFSRKENVHLCSINLNQYECDVRVIIILSPCKACPSECCLVYNVGNTDSFQITNAAFQIGEKPTSEVSKSLSFPLSLLFIQTQTMIYV